MRLWSIQPEMMGVEFLPCSISFCDMVVHNFLLLVDLVLIIVYPVCVFV